MCGIAGIITSDPDLITKAILAMNEAQVHRGPDDEGEVIIEVGNRFVGLGHRRLAIIDLTPLAHQPMLDEKRGNWIVHNGEVYNFHELRKELERVGELFKSNTDTEVILKAYGVWGKDSFHRLRGIFAFAIWDNSRRSLVLCRDPFGVKPLYFLKKGENLIFASEVRAILCTGLVPRRLDVDGLISFLTYGSLQEPYTMVSGIRSLPAGHFLEIRLDNIKASPLIRAYRVLPECVPLISYDIDSLTDELKERLKDAILSQMISDVPLGAFLSGGIDSTAIACLMKEANLGSVKTFSLVFEEKAYDERYWSRLAVKTIGTEHFEYHLSGEEVLSELDKAVKAYDQPSIDGLNTYFVSKAARQAGLTVALSGLGGDEVFGGYEGFAKSLLAEKIRPLVGIFPRTLSSIIARFCEPFTPNESIRKILGVLSTNRHPYFATRRLFSDAQVDRLLSSKISRTQNWQNLSFDEIEIRAQGFDAINRASALEMQTYMKSMLLRDTDQMSMAHSLEVRVPLLDPDLVEFLFTVPGTLKLDRHRPKPLLTRPLDGLIPKECIFRPKKGFELPFEVWLRKDLKNRIEELFASYESNKLFSEIGLRSLWRSFNAGKVSWSRVWAIYVLIEWLESQQIQL